MISLANNTEQLVDAQGNVIAGLSTTERRRLLNRALNATPFFNYMEFEILTGISKDREYGTKTDINLDFFLTEMRSNFGEVFDTTGALFDLNVYEAVTERSVYGFNRSEALPVPFLTTEARFDTVVANQIFQDTQREFFSSYIRGGERVIAEVTNTNAKGDNATAGLALVGYNLIKYPYLNGTALERINRSLESEPVFQTFKFQVDHNGLKYYNFFNDSMPRLILGAGIVNDSADKANISASRIQIEDSTRQLKLCNVMMPVEFFAPRLTCVLDTHQYYFPIEYYFEPFGNIRFQIENTYPVDRTDGYEMIIWTRTV